MVARLLPYSSTCNYSSKFKMIRYKTSVIGYRCLPIPFKEIIRRCSLIKNMHLVRLDYKIFPTKNHYLVDGNVGRPRPIICYTFFSQFLKLRFRQMVSTNVASSMLMKNAEVRC